MTRLARHLGFFAHLLRRLPAVIREGRLPHRPADVPPRLRASYRAFTRGAAASLPSDTGRRLPGPRARGIARLLFLSQSLNVEGAPISQFTLARGLDRHRYEIWVLSMEDGPLRERYDAAGIRVELANPLRGVHTEQAYLERLGELAEWVRRSDFNLILCNTLMCFWGVTVARAVGLPSVWCIRESVDWRTYFNYLDPPVARQALDCLGQADRLVFVADATRRFFPEPSSPSKARTIHNGLDVAGVEAFKRRRSRDAARAAHGVKDGDRVVSVIGTTCARKGQLDFLRAAAALQRRRDQALRFYLVGARDGEYLSCLKRFVIDEGLQSVVFVEETPHVYEYYRLSDIFVCSSYEESFPRVILEAMAFELPIVSTNVFGIAEALEEGSSGLLIGPGDMEGLAAGIGRLLDDPQLGRRLAANAYATLLSRFTVEQMVQQYDRLFTECLG